MRKLITDEEFEEWLRTKGGHLSNAEKEWVKENLLKKVREIFVRKGELPVMPIFTEYAEMRVEGEPKQDPIRYWSKEKEKKVEEEVKKLEDAGIVEDSESAWRSEWVLVMKSNGGIRPTTDDRKTLNQSAIFDAYDIEDRRAEKENGGLQPLLEHGRGECILSRGHHFRFSWTDSNKSTGGFEAVHEDPDGSISEWS